MATPDPIKILVVDDLPEKLLVYQSILDEPGLEVTVARSGAEALKHVLRHEFAVILLDVNMPDMDGFETAGLIRARKRSAHTPIIFVTAHADELHALRGYAYGAVDYILTPVVPEILRTKVRVFVQLNRLNQQAREHAAQRIAMVEREQAHLADLLERAADFVARVDRRGGILHVNRAARRMLGYNEGEELPRQLSAHQPEWAEEVLRDRAFPTARREGVWFGESALRARDGREISVSHVVLAHHTPEGEFEHYSVVAHDISERRRVEAELARYRAHLEDLVRERTAELEASHERLRLADRMASIGTLAAGLGHDMGNLLLPVRMRLDALARMELPEAAQEHAGAIAHACEYLKRLSQGLRLFALNPEDARASGERIELAAWWNEIAPFLRNALPREIALESSFPEDLPPIAMSPHVLTQTVYNLVQNAGDAMRGRGGSAGRVRIAAERSRDGGSVALEVSDNGPGMTEEVLRRCMEPFFTTKTRGISTGLGLALVRGALRNAGGAVDISSSPGQGATFRLTLPAASTGGDAGGDRRPAPALASVSLRDARMRSFVASVLRAMDVPIVGEDWANDGEATLVVADEPDGDAREFEAYLNAEAGRRAVVFGGANGSLAVPDGRIVRLGDRPTAQDVRRALAELVRSPRPAMEGAAT